MNKKEIKFKQIDLVEARANSRRVYKAIGKHWIKIFNIKKVKYVKGRCYAHPGRSEILINPLTTRLRLVSLAHEIGHVVLKHISNKKLRCVEEFEAEKFALALMKKYKIKFPRSRLNKGKRYVARKISMAVRRGLKRPIPKEVTRWAANVK